MDERDAEDIAQATLVAAVRGAGTFRGQGSFRGWLFGIAAHQATTFHRAQSTLKRGAGQIVPFPSVLEFRDDGKSPADISAENDRADLLHRALEELEETDRDLVHLHYFGELTCKEIATVRRMNAKTVSTRLSRCKDKLLLILGRSHFTHADG